MRSRLFILAAALFVGALSAVMAFGYLTAQAGKLSASSKPVDVLIAKKRVPSGTPVKDLVTEGFVETKKVPGGLKAIDALAKVDASDERVLSSDLVAGEQLTESRMKAPSEAGLAFTVPDGQVAVALPLDEGRGLEGLLKPGDNVAVLGTFEKDEDRSMTKVMVGLAKVLAIGDRMRDEAPKEDEDEGGLGGGDGDESYSRMVTLAVSPQDAEAVVLVQEHGRAWLTLLPANTTKPITAIPVIEALKK